MEKIIPVAIHKYTTKRKSNTFDSRIIKLSQSYCFYLAIEEIIQMHRVQKKKVTRDLFARIGGDRENKEGIRGTSNDPCLPLKVLFFSPFVDKTIWIRKSFYVQQLVLIEPARFTKSFLRRFCLTAQNVCVSPGLCRKNVLSLDRLWLRTELFEFPLRIPP